MQPESFTWNLAYAAHLGVRSPDNPLFSASAASAAPQDQIAFVAEIGFAGVEDNFFKLRSLEEQVSIGEALKRHGLRMGAFANNPTHWNKPLWGRNDAAARAHLDTDLAATISACQLVGPACVNCVTGLDDGMSQETQITNYIENLKRLADKAASAGVILCVEAVSKDRVPGLLVDRIEQAEEIVRAVDHPGVRLMYDTAHLQVSNDGLLSSLRQCWDLIAVIQVADMPGRVELGAGEIDWIPFLREIKRRDFAGLVEFELEVSEPGLDGERKLLERLAEIDAHL